MGKSTYAAVIVFVYTVLVLTQSESVIPDNFPSDSQDFQYRGQSYVESLGQLRNSIEQENNEELAEFTSQLQDIFSSVAREGYERSVQKLWTSDGESLLDRVGQTAPIPGNITINAQCINDTKLLLQQLLAGGNSSKRAFQFFDAASKPGPSLTKKRFNWVGNYRQCLSASVPEHQDRVIKGNYCVMRVIPLVNPMAVVARADLCVPETCSTYDVSVVFNILLMELAPNKGLVVYGDCINDDREYTTATILAIVMLCIIGALMLVGTAYDVIFIQWPKWQMEAFADEGLLTNTKKDPVSNGYNAEGQGNYPEASSNSANERTSLLNPALMTKTPRSPGDSILAKAILAFSVYTNGSKVLNTSQPASALTAINGMRFLSMSWVIMGHMFGFIIAYVDNENEAYPEFLKRWTFDAIDNALVSVDTFFTMSGLLTAYTTVNEMKRRGTWKINWPMFYFHRFWRLTPPYMLSILTVLGLQRFLGAGAQWPTVSPQDKTFCEDNWWTNLLYINNIVKPKEICFGHSWYLANDMQFFWLSPFMLIPFFISPVLGFASSTVFLLTQWITTGVLSTVNKWPSTITSLNVANAANTSWMMDYYFKPWCRIGPFIVGLMAGYFLSVKRGMRIPTYVNTIGWATATAVALAVLYGLHGDIAGESVSSIGTSAFYNAVSRSAWGACVCWVIIACALGSGGFVNTILSWSPFVTLGRLSYMAYLLHLSLIFTFLGNLDSTVHLNDTNIVILYLGILVFVYMVSFVFMLAFESPMIGLEKLWLRRKSD